MRAIANCLSLFRLVSVVPLLLLAWAGQPVGFLLLLLTAFATDAADGWFARRAAPNTNAALGARLDSYADYTLCFAVLVGIWWLWPGIMAREAFWLGLIVVAYALPGAAAIVRFGRPAAYHSWGAKAAVAVVAPALLLLLAGGPAWPLRIGSTIALLAGIEQCLMIRIAPGPREEVRSLR
ncbi:MAG: CDP-alcohol phosphatidyltransferase family protein, partial [Halofilum sp. (in: g-proteobacteria)]